jgi:hypothetical protein
MRDWWTGTIRRLPFLGFAMVGSSSSSSLSEAEDVCGGGALSISLFLFCPPSLEGFFLGVRGASVVVLLVGSSAGDLAAS